MEGIQDFGQGSHPYSDIFWLNDTEQYSTPWVSIFCIWETSVNKTKIPALLDFFTLMREIGMKNLSISVVSYN